MELFERLVFLESKVGSLGSEDIGASACLFWTGSGPFALIVVIRLSFGHLAFRVSHFDWKLYISGRFVLGFCGSSHFPAALRG